MKHLIKTIGLFSFVIGLMLIGCTASEKSFSAPVFKEVVPTATADYGDIGSEFVPNIEVESIFIFSGEIQRGETFEQAFGNRLLFCLLPDNLGWHIVVTHESQGHCDWSSPSYSGLLNPPFWGTNPTFIKGWHFRNENNTDKNDGSVNTPQEKRWINFLFNEQDYQIASEAMDCILRNDCGDLDVHQSRQMITNIPKSRATMNITQLELGNLVEGEQAWIESMEFEVEIPLPAIFENEDQ